MEPQDKKPAHTPQEINLLTETLVNDVKKAVDEVVPKEIIIEVPTDPPKKVRLIRLDYASSGTSWERVQAKFMIAKINNPHYREVRLHIHQDFILLCGVLIVDQQELDG